MLNKSVLDVQWLAQSSGFDSHAQGLSVWNVHVPVPFSACDVSDLEAWGWMTTLIYQV